MKKVIIIGSGAAGLTAAYLLKDTYHITLLEKDTHIGGHVHTVTVQDPHGAELNLDTGFMVLNDQTYPYLHRLFDMLGGIETGESDMSFGYYNQNTGIQYAINFNPQSEFSRTINLSETLPKEAQSVYRELLIQFLAFSKEALSALDKGELQGLTLGEYLQKSGISDLVKDTYLIPMAAAIWSTSMADMLAFPAENLFSFFRNHGLMTIGSNIRWKYVKQGSKTYAKRIIEALGAHQIIKNDAVSSVMRDQKGIRVVLKSGAVIDGDSAIFATHADEVLPLLADATGDEIAAFSSWSYQKNDAILHTDESVMPPNKAAWASWNYHVEANSTPELPLSVTYHLNRLQGHMTDTQYFLSLNRITPIPESKIIKRISFTHPKFSNASVKSRDAIRALFGTKGLYFCGSYMANGFHEDAVKSAFDMVAALNKNEQ